MRLLRVAAVLLIVLSCPVAPLHAQVVVEACNAPATPIIDQSTITDTIDIDASLLLADTLIFLDVDHTYIGDLVISVESPSGTTVDLQTNLGGGADTLRLTYWDDGDEYGTVSSYECLCLMRPVDPSLLDDCSGEAASGVWTLTIEDAFAIDSGTLNEWCVIGYAADPPLPVTDLACTGMTAVGGAELSWTNGASYDTVEIHVNGVLESIIGGSLNLGAAGFYTALPLDAAGAVEIGVRGVADGVPAPMPRCVFFGAPPADVVGCGALPYDFAGYTQDSILILEELWITEIEVYVDVTLAFEDYMPLSLKSPSGPEATISGDANPVAKVLLLFDDDGVSYDDTDLACGCAMEPIGPGTMSDFAVALSEGAWVLTVGYGFSSLPVLNEWCVRITGCNAAPPSGVTCSSSDLDINLSWVNEGTYDAIEIEQNGIVIASLSGESTTYTIVSDVDGFFAFRIVGIEFTPDCVMPSALCYVQAGISAACLLDAVIEGEAAGATLTVEIGATLVVETIEVLLVVEDAPATTYDWFIESPYGTQLRLLDGSGFGSSINVIWSDNGLPFADALGDFDCEMCSIQPAGPGAFADFAGEVAAGEWVLSRQGSTQFVVAAVCIQVHEGCGTLPPSDLYCESEQGVVLAWNSGALYGGIDVLRDGALLASIAGDATEYADLAPPSGHHAYRLIAFASDLSCSSRSRDCATFAGFESACLEDQTIPSLGTGSLFFAEPVVIGDVQLLFQFDALNANAWDFALTSPFGTEVKVQNNGGGAGGFDVIWSDSGAANTGAPGLYDCELCLVQPSGPGTFADFAGEIADGDWQLTSETNQAATIDRWCVAVAAGCVLGPPGEVTCISEENDVFLDWANNGDYDFVEAHRDGVILASFAGTVTSYVDENALGARYVYRIVAISVAEACSSGSPLCMVEHRLYEQCEASKVLLPIGATTDVTLSFVPTVAIHETEVFVDIVTGFSDGAINPLAISSPAGTEVVLFKNTAGAGNDFDVTFSDRGEVPNFSTDFACGGCTIRPSGPGTLGDFEEEDASGDWVLSATVNVAAGVALYEWCVRVYEGCSIVGPMGLACSDDFGTVDLEWTNAEVYSGIDVLRDDMILASLPGSATSYSDSAAVFGLSVYRVMGNSAVLECGMPSNECAISMGVAEVCDAPGTPTPTAGGSTSAVIEYPEELVIAEVQVSVDITHPFIGGLRVDVVAPDGDFITLHDHDGGDADDLRLTYADGGVPNGSVPYSCGCAMQPSGPGQLVDLTGSNSEGTWTLDISSNTNVAGELNEWCAGYYSSEPIVPANQFRRGDVNGDGIVNGLTDPLALLHWQFAGGASPPCLDAADANGDDAVSALLDALVLLRWQFEDGPAPPNPGPTECGVDPLDDENIECAEPPAACNP